MHITLDASMTAAVRVAAWQDVMSRSGMVDIDDPLTFHGEFRSECVDVMRTMRVSAATFRLARDTERSRRMSRDHVLLNLVEAGTINGRLARRIVVAKAGDVVVSRLTSLMDLRLVDATWYALLLPLAEVERHMRWLGRYDGIVHSGDTVAGGVLGALIRATDRIASASPDHAVRQIIETSVRTLAACLRAPPPRRMARKRDVTADDIRGFVVRHLPDPALDPAMIAAAFDLSRTALYRKMRESADLVRIIRRLRLNAIARDIASGAKDGRPLHAIAAGWGMPDERSFRRAFGREFGCAPSALRSGGGSGVIGLDLEQWLMGALEAPDRASEANAMD